MTIRFKLNFIFKNSIQNTPLAPLERGIYKIGNELRKGQERQPLIRR